MYKRPIDFRLDKQLGYSMLKVEIRRGGLIESTHRVHARVARIARAIRAQCAGPLDGVGPQEYCPRADG